MPIKTRSRLRVRSRGGGIPFYLNPSLRLNGVLPTRIDDFTRNRYYTSTGGVSGFPFAASARTTNGTMFDSQGRLIFAPANELLRSNDFTNPYWDVVLTQTPVLNPSGAPADPLGGSNTWRLTANVGGAGSYAGLFRANNALVFATGTTYVQSVYARANTSNFVGLRLTGGSVGPSDTYCYYNLTTGVATAITPSSGTIVSVGMSSVGNGWWRCWLIYTTGSSISSNLFDIAIPFNSTGGTPGPYTGTESIWIYGGQIERYDVQSPKAYIPTTSTAFYGPRLDTNPATLQPAGLLVEDQAENRITNSQNLTGSGWVNNDITTVASGLNSPMGMLNAFKINETATTASHSLQAPTATLTASNPCTVSVFARAGERNFVIIQVNDGSSANAAWCSFNLTTGAVVQSPTNIVGSFSSMSAWSQNCGNGWWRVFFAFTINTTANVITYFGTSPNGTDRSFLGVVSNGIHLFGAQMTPVGATTQSYIPTAASTGVRSTETYSTANLTWYNTANSTIYIESNSRENIVSNGLISINDGAASNRIDMRADGQYVITVSSVTQRNSDSGTPSQVTNNKMAMRYNASATSAFLNAGAPGTSTSGTIPTTALNLVRFGCLDDAAAFRLNGHLREIRYYPSSSASDAQMQALTTLGVLFLTASGLFLTDSLGFLLTTVA